MFKCFENKNTLLLNTIYHKPYKDENGKWQDDAITAVYRDLDTNEKKMETIIAPQMEIFITKDGMMPSHPLAFIKKDLVEPHMVSYRNITKDIANLLGREYQNFFQSNIENRNFARNKNLHKAKRVFKSDLDINDYARIEYFKKCEPSNLIIHKSFFDIEVDAKGHVGFPDEQVAAWPINAITYIDDKRNECYTLLLRNPDNPLVEELELNAKDFIKEISEEFSTDLKVDLTYKIAFFDNEIDLIATLFKIINTIKPDFALAWNARFDMITIINRIKRLGYNPEDIICHPDFKRKNCYYHVDKRADVAAERGDYGDFSSYTIFMDQLINYAGVRKSASKNSLKGGFKLDATGMRECKIGKQSYKHVTTDLMELPYLDYRLFVKYNIRDVIVQLVVERKTEDLNNILTKCIHNCTRYSKIFKQSIFLKNRFTKDYETKMGLIIGNNHNVDYGNYNGGDDEDKEKYEGALVGDPKLNGYNGIMINGKKSMYIYDNVIDVDLSSLYPSIIRAFNMAPNCMHFRIVIDEQVGNENQFSFDKYDRGGDLIDNYETKQYIKIGAKWLNLPGYSELTDLIMEIAEGRYVDDSNDYQHINLEYISPIMETGTVIRMETINPIKVVGKNA